MFSNTLSSLARCLASARSRIEVERAEELCTLATCEQTNGSTPSFFNELIIKRCARASLKTFRSIASTSSSNW